jgi:hypothetical protein
MARLIVDSYYSSSSIKCTSELTQAPAPNVLSASASISASPLLPSHYQHQHKHILT